MPPLVIPAAPKPSAQIPSPLGAQKAAAPKVGGRSGLVGKVLVPLAPPSKRAGHKVANGCVLGEEAQKELDDLSDALFQLADQDGSGTIQFCEFSSIHRELMRLASDQNPSFSSLSSAATEELEKQFRAMDADFSMFLDREEWNKYMVSLLAVVGPKCFKAMCKAFIQEEDQRKDQWKEKYDNLISARLVERVQAATVLAGRSHAVLDVEAMLDKRADPNFVDGQGGSALLYAAEKADAAFMKRLLAAGASPHLHNKDMECPAFFAARSRNLEALRLLLLHRPVDLPPTSPKAHDVLGHSHSLLVSRELVQDMARLGEREVRDLLLKRADVNFKDENGWTPLTAAVFWGKKETVEAILRQQQVFTSVRLRVNVPNARGRSALHIAARKGLVELVPLLVAARADVDQLDVDGWTPLHHAAFNGLDDVVEALVKAFATVNLQGRSGFTPWMVSLLPSRAGQLKESTVRLLMPNDNVSMSKRVLPILSNEKLTPYGKLEQLLSFPTVTFCSKNLRMYEQFFHVRSGPNKVRLQKVWEGIARDMLKRMLTGDVDLQPLESNADPKDVEERELEIARRARDQRSFLKQWLSDTMGPPRGTEWHWDNREGYREELDTVMRGERTAFRSEFDSIYASMQEDEAGQALVVGDVREVLLPQCATQKGAHPILEWLDALNPADAFEALRRLGARGMGKDDDEALMCFMDLICSDVHFDTGELFWKNVYKLWLSLYASAAHTDFQHRVKTVVNDFNLKHERHGLVARYRAGRPKSFERILAKEAMSPSTDKCHDSRTGRAASLLDVVRGSITVNEPKAITLLVDDFFRPLNPLLNKLQVSMITNGFSRQAATPDGFRDIVLNVLFDGGRRSTLCNRSLSMTLSVVGEVRITLEDFMRTKRRAVVISQYFGGVFDQVSEEQQVWKRVKGKRRSTATPAKCVNLGGDVEAGSPSHPS